MRKDLAITYGTGTEASLNQLKGSLEDTLGAVLKREILDGVLIKDVVLSTSTKEIPHKLGRDYTGYIVVKRRTWNALISEPDRTTPFTGSIYESESEDSSTYINLYSSGDVSVNIWVF